MLCEKCTTITFKPFEDCELDGKLLEIEQLNDPSLSQSSVFYFHHEDEGELRRSAASGCHFCVMIMHKLFEGQDHPFYAQNRHPLKTHCQHVLLRKPWPRDVILSSLEDGSRTISDKLEVYCGEQGVITFRAEEDLSGRRLINIIHIPSFQRVQIQCYTGRHLQCIIMLQHNISGRTSTSRVK
ncbi:hypothetical protein M501DRAFT_803608 [Patellaria atrata CBS 101060]|uniref:Uncharacterized protein n=1 Tax=Patellaria atrata CBS 101060 TaxID=1346257 RepID=A0A9P4SB91_9PEZI|nr:hypothetical protein M501DRAFT_803608 [Patellaria atrata CBS 101060]